MQKYKINSYLRHLTKEEFDIACRTLPKRIGISKRTWFNWRAIGINDDASIPSDKLYQLAVFFGVTMEDMFTILPDTVEKETSKSKLAKKLNLSK